MARTEGSKQYALTSTRQFSFTLIPRERLKSLKTYDKNGFESFEGTEKLLLEWKHLFQEALLAIRLNIRLVIGFKNTGTYQGYI